MVTTRSRHRDRIGVLSLHNSKETKAILNAIDALGAEPVWLREETCQSALRDGMVQFDPPVDVVINRLLLTKTDRPLEDLGLASAYDDIVPVLNPPHAVLRAVHKFGAATTLAHAGLPQPDAFLALTREGLAGARASFRGEVVHKTAIGTNGHRMSRSDAPMPPSPSVAGRRTYLQEFVENGDARPWDVRVYVVGGRVVGAMRRYAPAGDWRTNVARGGAVEAADDLGPEPLDLARNAAASLGLDYAGVDLIHGDHWYVLEANPTAGFKGLFRATGTSPAPYIAALAIERAGGEVDEAHAAQLAERLDDAVPACKPTSRRSRPQRAVIGYTERIGLAGRGGTEVVIAKADTGAARTSVDVNLAADIGAGPIKGTATVKSGSRPSGQTRPLVDVEVGIDGRWQTVTASIHDRRNLSHPVLLGRDVLDGYRVDVERRAEEE